MAIRFLIATSLVLCWASNGFADDEVKFPTGADVHTRSDWAKELRAYDAQFVDSYRQHTADAEGLRDDCAKLVEQFLLFTFGLSNQRAEELRSRAQALMEKGSADPWILTIRVAFTDLKANRKLVTDLLDRIDAAIAKSEYGTRDRAILMMNAFVLRQRLANEFQNDKKNRPASPNKKPVYEAVLKWLAEEAQTPEHRRYAWGHLTGFFEQYTHDQRKALADLAKNRKDVDPWYVEMLYATYYGEEGWRWYDTNADTQRDEFLNLIRPACEHYTKAWKLAPEIPDSAAELISMGREKISDESATIWFNRAIAAQFDYAPAYPKYRTALCPDYGGSCEELLSFGTICAQTERYDTCVPFELLETMRVIEKVEGAEAEIWRRPGYYEAVRKMCEKASAAPVFNGLKNDKVCQSWIAATQIAVAVRADKWGDIQPLLPKTSNEDLAQACENYHVTMSPEALRQKSTIASAKLSIDEVDQVLANIEDDEAATRAIARLKDIEDQLPAKSDKAWLKSQKAELELCRRFFAGKWVDVTFAKDSVTITGIRDWEVQDERTLVSKSSFPLPLGWLAKLRAPYELSMNVETLELSKNISLAGILLGSDHETEDAPHGRFFGVSSITKRGGSRIGPTHSFPINSLPVNEVRVLAWPTYYEFFVNGEQYDSQFDSKFSPFGAVNIGVTDGKSSKIHVKFSQLKVRRLPLSAPPGAEKPKERIDYYSKLIEADPTDLYNYISRGEMLTVNGESELAMKDYQYALDHRKDYLPAQLLIGVAYTRRGDYAQAKEMFEKILKQAPNHAATLQRLAWIESTCPDEKFRDKTKAVEHARRAIREGEGVDGLYFMTLAAAYAEAGNYSDALKWLNNVDVRRVPYTKRDMLPNMKTAFEANRPYIDDPSDTKPAKP